MKAREYIFIYALKYTVTIIMSTNFAKCNWQFAASLLLDLKPHKIRVTRYTSEHVINQLNDVKDKHRKTLTT